ncbi:MAG: hypothetical protein IKR25_08585 [Muribaculaceae bacterium]|nr:hypothetical protein [Muribaculaceae bacterium]
MMKKIYLLLTALLCSLSMSAQDTSYTPLVREGVRWVYLFYEAWDNGSNWVGHGEFVYYLEFRGDTIVDSTTYKKLYCTLNPLESEQSARPVALMRENDRHVYAMVLKDAEFAYGYDETSPEIPILEWVARGTETELLDFNDIPAFIEGWLTNAYGEFDYTPIIPQPTTVIVDGQQTQAWTWWDGYIKVIEGVGCDTGDLLDVGPRAYPTCECPIKYGLVQQETLDGRILYKGPFYYGVHTPRATADINTVNTLINQILGKSRIAIQELDYNADFTLDIDDLNILVNFILKK